MEAAIQRASQATGVDFSFLMGAAKRESGFNPSAQAGTSSAAGLFQFVEQTWMGTLKQHGAKYGYARYAARISRGSDGRYFVNGAEAKKAFASVMLEQGVPGFYLPEGSHILALTNVDATDGITKEFDFIIGRRKEYTIDPSVQVWDEDFASKPYMHKDKQWSVSPLFRAWAKQRPGVFFEAKPKKQGPWCNPRSACANDRYLQVLTAQNGGVIPLQDAGMMSGLEGGFGMPATQSLLEFMEFQINLPDRATVVADPATAPMPKSADQIMLMAYKLAAETLPDEVGPVIEYVQRMPKDMSITFVQSLFRRAGKEFAPLPAIHGWIAKNASLLTIINSLAQA